MHSKHCDKEEMITEMKVKVDELHDIMFNYKKRGLLQEWTEFKGALKIVGWILSSTVLVTLATFLYNYLK